MNFPVPPFHDFKPGVPLPQRDQDLIAWLNRLNDWGKQLDKQLADLQAAVAALQGGA